MKKELNFKLPANAKLSARKSTINNAFAQSITPRIDLDYNEVANCYKKLNVIEGQCAYCGRKNLPITSDHFRALVNDGMPSGYATIKSNLIPCCSECNSKKGKKEFNEWYMSKENVDRILGYNEIFKIEKDMINQKNRINKYINSFKFVKLDYEKIVGKDKWDEFIERKNKINKELENDQAFCNELKDKIEKYVKTIKI